MVLESVRMGWKLHMGWGYTGYTWEGVTPQPSPSQIYMQESISGPLFKSFAGILLMLLLLLVLDMFF